MFYNKTLEFVSNKRDCSIIDICMPEHEDGKCYKLVWVPPEYEETTEEVVVKEAWEEIIFHPPVWREETVEIACGTDETWEETTCGEDLVICAKSDEQVHTIVKQVIEEEGYTETIEHPAETTIVTCRVQTVPGYYTWEEVPCE